MFLSNKTVVRAETIREALAKNNATGIAFGGITYTEFCSGIAPSFEKRAEYERTFMVQEGLRQEIYNADVVTARYVGLYRDGIRSCSGLGPNSSVYVECGYVADNQKRSGLVRPSSNEPPPTGNTN